MKRGLITVQCCPLSISRTTVKRILKENGIEPAPIEKKGMSRTTFIKTHLGEILAADFLTAELLRPISPYVYVIIDI